jgi:hypothetical protein
VAPTPWPSSRQEGGAERQQFVDHRADTVAAAHEIAQIDEPVAVFDAVAELGVERPEALVLAMDGGDRPDPLGAAKDGELMLIGHPLWIHCPETTPASRFDAGAL